MIPAASCCTLLRTAVGPKSEVQSEVLQLLPSHAEQPDNTIHTELPNNTIAHWEELAAQEPGEGLCVCARVCACVCLLLYVAVCVCSVCAVQAACV